MRRGVPSRCEKTGNRGPSGQHGGSGDRKRTWVADAAPLAYFSSSNVPQRLGSDATGNEDVTLKDWSPSSESCSW
jgi:hypothetical protein